MELELYKKRIKNLIRNFEEINSEAILPHQKWGKMMNLQRELCLFLHRDYLRKAITKNYATINPSDSLVCFDISQDEDFVDLFYPLFANSLGPYIPESFFYQDITFTWVLREPYIYKESWEKGDCGGHNQIEYYNTEEKIKKANNPTHNTIIDLTGKILQQRNGSKVSIKEVMERIAIIELNHFPGLAFKSTKTNNSIISLWASLHEELIKYYLQFLGSKVIIGHKKTLSGLTEGHEEAKYGFFDYLQYHSFEEMKSEEGYPTATILDYDIENSFQGHHTYTPETGTNAGKPKEKRSSAIIDSGKRLWVGYQDQLSYGPWKNEELKTNFSNWINKFISNV